MNFKECTDRKYVSYPTTWIEEARSKNSLKCTDLVYKNGCEELRRGDIEVGITLDHVGKVVGVVQLRSTIRTDPRLVFNCVKEELVLWKFKPPTRFLNYFNMIFLFRDKC